MSDRNASDAESVARLADAGWGRIEAEAMKLALRVVDAEAEVERLRAWIDGEGRNCPSNATIDAVLAKTGRDDG